MHRLLQGDVGSGKTAVAFAACIAAIGSGFQAALMAPTEVLAQQHHTALCRLAEQLGIAVGLLTASTTEAARRSLLASAQGGNIDLLVGTHALLGPRVQLPKLALIVIDEQHRFGVVQRAQLRDRTGLGSGTGDGRMPHLLVMSATPIPRTLALTHYGDLDISVLDEKPPGRRPARTLLYNEPLLGHGGRALALVEERLRAGHQVFVVCPLVEESEKLAVADAMGTAARLAAELPQHRIDLVHGRLAPALRDRVMDAFRRREIDVLVATTVIEVGIDVPSANVMVVEHADRFGLAQLHQLRGRVGRGGDEAHCLLLSGVAQTAAAWQRLKVLVDTADGFVVAEADLAQRGPGELFGTRQSGLPRLRFADSHRHLRMLARAQQEARAVLDADPELTRPEHQGARLAMERRWGDLPLFGGEAG